MRLVLLALLLAGDVDVALDSSETPDLAEWGARAQALTREWYPKVAEALASDGFTPPGRVSIVLKAKQDAPGATGGTRVSFSGPYVRKHPEDWGMVVHELVHVVQKYPDPNPMWLTDGIADYVRDFVYEPGKRKVRLDPKKASYKDSYATTAAFLGWLEKLKPGAVKALNAAMRKKAYRPELWTEIGGKDVDALWADFVSAR